MFRVGCKRALQVKVLPHGKPIVVHQKYLSNNASSGGSGLKTAGVIGSAILVGCGGTVVYAKTNPNFRRMVEDSVPGSTMVLDAVIGKSSDVSTSTPKARSKLEANRFEKPLIKQTGNETKAIAEEVPAVSSGSALSSVLEKQEQLALSSLSAASEEEAARSSITIDESTSIPDPEVSIPGIPPKLENEEAMKISSKQEFKAPSSVPVESGESSQHHQTSSGELNLSEEFVPQNKESVGFSSLRNEHMISAGKILEEMENEKRTAAEASTWILDDLLSGYSVACANAILANTAAADAVAFHSSLLRTAMDDARAAADEKSLQWSDVSRASNAKEFKLKEADTCYQRAIEELVKIKEVIEQSDIKNDPNVTQKVIEIEQSCLDLSKELESAKSKVIHSNTEAEALSKYIKLVEEAKSKLQREISLPEPKVEEEWKREGNKLSQREEFEILQHMQYKVDHLQQQLAEERNSATKRLQETIASIRNDTEKQIKDETDNEMQRSLDEYKLDYERKITEARCSFENELENRLKKQATLHAEHLAEALAYMDKRSAIKYENALHEELEKQNKKFQETLEEEKATFDAQISYVHDQYMTDMNVALARIQGIERAIDGRAFIESESRKAQELSLACDTLMVSIKYGDDGKPLPLKKQVEIVKKAYMDHTDISAICSTLPQEAEARGVFPEEAIRNSFRQVAKLCRRLSMVDEKRNSLFVYFLSYLKSLFTISNASLVPPAEIDKTALDVFTLVSYASHCVQHGDIEQAVRFLNQLNGESRKVAEGWLREARLFLETRQSVEALCALSNAIVIGAQLEE